MKEYFSEAIVLDRENSGDQDLRVSLLTKRFGKLTGKVKSARKITSKLAGHLLPADLVKARFIEKNGLQLVDALKIGEVKADVFDLARIKRVLGEAEADAELWSSLSGGKVVWREILQKLGWDPAEAVCDVCKAPEAAGFHMPSQTFFCKNCVSRSAQDEVILIG